MGNMKLRSIILLIFFPFGLLNSQIYHSYYSFKTLDAGNIKLSSDNIGGLKWVGTKWKTINYEYDNIVFDHGPWVIGKMNGKPVLAFNQWFRNYSPGPIINGQAAMLINPEDSAKYRVYKISKGDSSSNPDFSEWPANFGAPTKNDSTPLIYGDQILWTVFNILDSTIDNQNYHPIEFHQTIFCRRDSTSINKDILDNTVLMEWTIINKGLANLDSAYFGFWTDIDITVFYDKPGIDTINQLGYCWSEKSYYYDTTQISPAIGYTLLYGPIVPEPGNTALFKGKLKEGYKNLKLISFHAIADDSYSLVDSLVNPISFSSPTQVRSFTQALNIAKGLYPEGSPIVSPVTNQITTFPFSGDPVTGEGWVYDHWSGSGAGFIFFTGPFTIASNDTQWVMIALVPGLGSSNINSIEVMRNNVIQLRSIPYDSLANFEKDTSSIQVPLPVTFRLYQNYPNPFNSISVIRYELPEKQIVSLKVYDLLGQEVETLVNTEQTVGVYQIQFDASTLSSGIYFYKLQAGNFVSTKKMILLK